MARSRYIDQLSRFEGNGLIKVVTGLRRSGKSFLLKKLFRQHLLDDGVTEKRPLRMVDDSFRKLLVVGEHTKQWSDEDRIQVISIYDFLLNLSSTEKL